MLKWSGRACLDAPVPANVQAHIWHCLSVSWSVCPLGWMHVWLVNNQPSWLLIMLSAAEAGGLTYHSSRSHSPCDVISLHLVTLHYTSLRRPVFLASLRGAGAENPRCFHHNRVDVTAPVAKRRPLIEKHRTSLSPPSPRATPGAFPPQSYGAPGALWDREPLTRRRARSSRTSQSGRPASSADVGDGKSGVVV